MVTGLFTYLCTSSLPLYSNIQVDSINPMILPVTRVGTIFTPFGILPCQDGAEISAPLSLLLVCRELYYARKMDIDITS